MSKEEKINKLLGRVKSKEDLIKLYASVDFKKLKNEYSISDEELETLIIDFIRNDLERRMQKFLDEEFNKMWFGSPTGKPIGLLNIKESK